MVQYSGPRLAGAPCPLAPQTCYSSIFAQRLCCPELGRSHLQVSSLQECFDTCCFLRGDLSPVWYCGCLLHCSVLNSYWRAARRPLVFLKLDIPPRHGQKATSSGVDFFQKQLPPPKACQNLFHAPGRHFSLLGISVLLSITPAASAKSDIIYPINKKFSSWDRLLLIACISDAHNCGSLLLPSIYSWRNKGRGFSSVHPEKNPSPAVSTRSSSLLCWVLHAPHHDNAMISPGSHF